MGKIGSVYDLDLSEQVIRHPCQITSVGNLVGGHHYAYVHACSQRGYMVSDYLFYGLFLAGEVMDKIVWQFQTLSELKHDTLGFTLHSDGWVRDRHIDVPSHVQWSGSQFCSYSNYGYNYGLDDLNQPDSIQHHIVVPWTDWLRDPKMLCDYEGDQVEVQSELSFAPPEIDIDKRHKNGRDALLNSVFGQ